MDTSNAVSEPMRRLIDHHNAFNRRIKLLYGSLNKVMVEGLEEDHETTLPYGDEPWGTPKTWRSAIDGHAASELLTELGIVRAASAFEDFLRGVISEIDRAQIPTPLSTQADPIERVFQLLSIEGAAKPPLATVRFFDCARNCIVHQMGRANSELVTVSGNEELQKTLAASSARKNARWKPTLPPISLGASVAWKPRHAILASDAYYRIAVAIDSKLVDALGHARFVAMASHWAVAAPVPVATARRTLVATVRSALNARYRTSIKAHEIGPLLKSVDKWESLKQLFQRNYPNRPLS